MLSVEQLDRICHHKYQRDGESLVETFFYPFWQWFESLFPSWLAPNCITVGGLFANLIGISVLGYYSPDAKQPAPFWAYFVAAVCIIVYNVFDSTDGLHARRTRSASALGELFDHGCDSVSQVFICMELSICIQLGETPRCVLLFYLLSSTIFYCAHWETYVTGKLHFNRFDASEGELCIVFFLCLSGYYGPGVWSKEIFHLPLRYFVIAFAVSVVIINTFVYMMGIVDVGSHKFETAVMIPLINLLTIQLPPVLLYRASQTNVLREEIVVFFIACGMISCKKSIQIIVSSMSGKDLEIWDSILWGPIIVLLNYYINTPIPERFCLHLFLMYSCVNFLLYFWTIADQIRRRLNIRFFQIPHSVIFFYSVKTASTIFNQPTDPVDGRPESTSRPQFLDILLNTENDTTDIIDYLLTNYTVNGSETVLDGSPVYQAGPRDTLPSLSCGLLLFASAVATVCLFLALWKTKAVFVVPAMILVIASIVAFILMVIFCIIALSVNSSELNTYIRRQLRSSEHFHDLPDTTTFLAKLAAGVGIVIFSLGTVLELAFLRVLKMCDGYLKDKKSFLEDHPADVRYLAIDENDADDTAGVIIMDTQRSQRELVAK